MALGKYHAKRHFKQTPEPKGAASKGPHRAHRFVIHKHAASHLHFDLRLEWDGVLKSWAVPKGPSMDPSVRRLAVHVEDHPLAYRTFKGIIPKGNYGAGKVEIWDEGTFEVPGVTGWDETEKILKKKFANGEITFTLHGKRLHDTFALVKMEKPGMKGDNWLLFKKHHTDVPVQTKTVSKADSTGVRRAMPHHVHPMLAQVAEAPFSREGWIFEMKWDGYRALAEVHHGSARLYSRNEMDLDEKFSSIVEELRKMKTDAVLDGEVVALDGHGRPSFQLLQEHQKTRKGELFYQVFDLLYVNGHDLRGLPLLERKRQLKELLGKRLPHVRYSEHVEKNGIGLFRNAKRRGLEGVMAKRADSTYQTGTRSDDWQKMKSVQEQEAVVVGYTEPRGTREHIGALVLGVYREGELIYIGHTGAAMSGAMLGDLHKKLKKIEQSKSAFSDLPKTNAPVHWVKPILVVQVKFQEWTKDGSMRQPIFLGMRDDKKARDVVKEEAPKHSKKGKDTSTMIFESHSPKEKEKAGKTITFGSKSIEFTHTDKVFWPKEGITKGDVLAHYRSVAKYLLPLIKDRPESLHRFPNGVEEEGFFQKDMPNAPSWAKTAHERSESDSSNVEYLVCNDEMTLVYMVQLGCVEMNPWNSRIGKIDRPDYAILDLDPQDVPFSAVVKTARAIKQVLDSIGAKGYCKTSGSHGMHIYIPLDAKYTYEQARLFAQLIGKLTHDKLPNLVSYERAQDKRKGRVYVDYPQNRKGATTVAAYSIRPRPGATVSTPLRWSEVKLGLDPAAFTIKTIGRRLARVGDLWKPVLGRGIDLKRCLDKLEKMRKK